MLIFSVMMWFSMLQTVLTEGKGMTATTRRSKHVLYEPVCSDKGPAYIIVAAEGDNRFFWTGKNWSLNSSEALQLGKLCLIRDEMDFIENKGLM